MRWRGWLVLLSSITGPLVAQSERADSVARAVAEAARQRRIAAAEQHLAERATPPEQGVSTSRLAPAAQARCEATYEVWPGHWEPSVYTARVPLTSQDSVDLCAVPAKERHLLLRARDIELTLKTSGTAMVKASWSARVIPDSVGYVFFGRAVSATTPLATFRDFAGAIDSVQFFYIRWDPRGQQRTMAAAARPYLLRLNRFDDFELCRLDDIPDPCGEVWLHDDGHVDFHNAKYYLVQLRTPARIHSRRSATFDYVPVRDAP